MGAGVGVAPTGALAYETGRNLVLPAWRERLESHQHLPGFSGPCRLTTLHSRKFGRPGGICALPVGFGNQPVHLDISDLKCPSEKIHRSSRSLGIGRLLRRPPSMTDGWQIEMAKTSARAGCATRAHETRPLPALAAGWLPRKSDGAVRWFRPRIKGRRWFEPRGRLGGECARITGLKPRSPHWLDDETKKWSRAAGVAV
jgi:hypothetical protein